jgi:AraC-like DNA-binding protein
MPSPFAAAVPPTASTAHSSIHPAEAGRQPREGGTVPARPASDAPSREEGAALAGGAIRPSSPLPFPRGPLAPASDPLLADPRLGALRVHLLAHLDRPLPLDRAAAIAGLERTYFSAYFHRRVGVRFRDWLTSQRVERAIDLMRTTTMPVAAVAHAVGFGSLRTLERALKRACGATPRQLRQEANRKAEVPASVIGVEPGTATQQPGRGDAPHASPLG